MPRTCNSINSYQNRPKTKLVFAKKIQNFRALGASTPYLRASRKKNVFFFKKTKGKNMYITIPDKSFNFDISGIIIFKEFQEKNFK